VWGVWGGGVVRWVIVGGWCGGGGRVGGLGGGGGGGRGIENVIVQVSDCHQGK